MCDFVSHLGELPLIPDNQTKMPAALVAKLINLGQSEKLMISELEKRPTFATRLKFEVENVFIKRLRLGKIVKQMKKFYAHDEQNQAKPGDTVRIMETRPMSKLKRWRLVEVVQK